MLNEPGKPRIAIDMDEVIADVVPKFKELFEATFKRKVRKEDYWGKKVYQIEGALHIRKSLQEKGFFADLPVMPDSQEVIRELMEEYEIYIVTAAMEFRNSLEDKYDWMARHFPFIPWQNIVMCGDKSIIGTDFMIDDHIHNLESFSGHGVLFTASHNIHETRFTRVNNWSEVRNLFLEEIPKNRA